MELECTGNQTSRAAELSTFNRSLQCFCHKRCSLSANMETKIFPVECSEMYLGDDALTIFSFSGHSCKLILSSCSFYEHPSVKVLPYHHSYRLRVSRECFLTTTIANLGSKISSILDKIRFCVSDFAKLARCANVRKGGHGPAVRASVLPCTTYTR